MNWWGLGIELCHSSPLRLKDVRFRMLPPSWAEVYWWLICPFCEIFLFFKKGKFAKTLAEKSQANTVCTGFIDRCIYALNSARYLAGGIEIPTPLCADYVSDGGQMTRTVPWNSHSRGAWGVSYCVRPWSPSLVFRESRLLCNKHPLTHNRASLWCSAQGLWWVSVTV